MKRGDIENHIYKGPLYERYLTFMNDPIRKQFSDALYKIHSMASIKRIIINNKTLEQTIELDDLSQDKINYIHEQLKQYELSTYSDILKETTN